MLGLMGMMTQAGGGGGGGSPVTDTSIYVGGGYTSTTLTGVHTFSSADIGIPTANRWVCCVWAAALNSATSVTSFKLDGDDPDFSDYQFNNGNGFAGIAIWKRPSGTTGEFVLTMNNNASGCVMQVFAFESSAEDPRYDTYGSSLSANSTTIDVEEGGAVFAAIGIRGGNSGHSWTGVNETEEEDINTNEWCSTGGIGSLSAETNRSVSYSSGVSNGSGFVVWSVSPN